MDDVEFRLGKVGDAEAVRALLASEGLPVEDLAGANQEFVIALSRGRLVGCIAVEVAGEDCVLRSLAVRADHRGKGFEQVDRASVPPGVAALPQFRGICPSTAASMRRRIAGEARHYPRDVLRLRPDVPGAAYFAVALERVMLTWFEVGPGTRFERHAHEADQITMVLEGELVFELDSREERVAAGEVIALPAGVPHAVRALGGSARA